LNTGIRIFYSISTNHLSDPTLNTVYRWKEYNIVSLEWYRIPRISTAEAWLVVNWNQGE